MTASDLTRSDDEILATVIRETRRVRTVRMGAALIPGALVAIASLALALTPALAAIGAAVAALGFGWQWWVLGPLPRGRLSLFDGTHEWTHMTFSGTWVYTSLAGRRIRLFGQTVAAAPFRQVLRRRWPNHPQFVSVLPLAH